MYLDHIHDHYIVELSLKYPDFKTDPLYTVLSHGF